MSYINEVELKTVADYGNDKIDATLLNSSNYISTDNLLPEKGGVTNSDYVPIKGRVSKYSIGDTLVSNIRPYFKKILFAKEVGGCSNDVIVFKPKKEKVDPKYLYYQLSKDDFFDFMMSGANGTKMPRGNKKSIPNFKLYLPDKNTQKHIASIISAYDDLIENNLKRIKLLEEIAQRTYEEWFVKFRVNGELLPIEKKTGFPFGWEIVKVNDLLAKAPSTIKIPSSEIFKSGSIPVVDQSRDFIAGFTNDKDSRIISSSPLIVFGDHTRVLKFINFPFARGSDGTQLILSNNRRMPQHLFYHTLLNIDLSNYHYARHFKFLKDTEIILPDKDNAVKFEMICKENYDMIKNLRLQNQNLKESRDILLSKLMNGTLNVES